LRARCAPHRLEAAPVSRIAARILTVDDAEYFARRRLPRSLAQAIEVGEPVSTFGRNLAAFEQVSFRPRSAVWHPARDLSTTVVGHAIALPVMIAPTGNLRLFHRDAEPGVARAAGAAATIQCVSTLTGHPIEEITATASGPVFFQVYLLGGRANAEANIDRALRAGCGALVVTVDTAARYQARRSVRERAYLPYSISAESIIRFLPQAVRRPRWLKDFLADPGALETPMVLRKDGTAMSMAEASTALPNEIPTWSDLDWIRAQWPGPIIVKGILTAEDARRAVSHGASAVVVSNHGGHLLLGSPPTLRVLPEVVDAVGNEVEILLDSGVRSGGDVVKAVALGARAVLIGRAYLWPLAAAGEVGVRRILDVFRDGIDSTLALIGCASIAALDASYVTAPREWRDGSGV
jgi:isopentenyl diphosphate isomerase/L-lactate dehydrogenase-like FMN-dependent dehydrogenase